CFKLKTAYEIFTWLEFRRVLFRPDMGDARRGIVHVVAPELGLTRPGMTVVCGDSHTSTHGAFGAMAFGIGTSEVGHVLATQCLQIGSASCRARADLSVHATHHAPT